MPNVLEINVNILNRIAGTASHRACCCCCCCCLCCCCYNLLPTQECHRPFTFHFKMQTTLRSPNIYYCTIYHTRLINSINNTDESIGQLVIKTFSFEYFPSRNAYRQQIPKKKHSFQLNFNYVRNNCIEPSLAGV